MRRADLVFGQRLVDGFRGPNECDEAQQVGGGQDHGGDAKAGHGRQTVHRLGERPQKKNAESRDVSADIVTEAGAGGAQPGGEQFGKVNRVTAERGEDAKTEDGPEIPNLRRAAER